MLDRLREHAALFVEGEDEQACKLVVAGEFEDRSITAE
jgi:hypothetical protein